jgi:hypothetical protein
MSSPSDIEGEAEISHLSLNVSFTGDKGPELPANNTHPFSDRSKGNAMINTVPSCGGKNLTIRVV